MKLLIPGLDLLKAGSLGHLENEPALGRFLSLCFSFFLINSTFQINEEIFLNENSKKSLRYDIFSEKCLHMKFQSEGQPDGMEETDYEIIHLMGAPHLAAMARAEAVELAGMGSLDHITWLPSRVLRKPSSRDLHFSMCPKLHLHLICHEKCPPHTNIFE